MTKKEAIEKIKKCLKLSSSANEHEAEIALRQAQAIMEKFGIDDVDIEASEAGESDANSASKSTPSRWETGLAKRVSEAFGCQLIFKQGITRGAWSFVGATPHHEIASYTFNVLYRLCKKARKDYMDSKLKRCARATAIRRADLFCEGWVIAVSGKIHAMVPGDKQQLAITSYLHINYPSLVDGKARDRNNGRALRDYDYRDRMHGIQSGQDTELNRGVGAAEQELLN